MLRLATRPLARNGSDHHRMDVHAVTIGMPELSRTGLSENWLIKACGHQHWLALAQVHDLGSPLFRDASGARLYPAFTSVSTTGARFENVAEGQMLELHLTLHRTSRTCFRSEIAVLADGLAAASLTMESAFIRRNILDSNRSVQRAIVDAPCLLSAPASGLRARREIEWTGAQAAASILLDPSPHEDFNGVGLLYCASFQAMLDRAEWAWFRQIDPLLATRSRSILFLGNVELGEQVRATLHAPTRSETGMTHSIELARASDGAPIARAVSERAFVPASDLLRRVA